MTSLAIAGRFKATIRSALPITALKPTALLGDLSPRQLLITCSAGGFTSVCYIFTQRCQWRQQGCVGLKGGVRDIGEGVAIARDG